MKRKIILLLLLATISLTGCGNTEAEKPKEDNKTVSDIRVPEQGTITVPEQGTITTPEQGNIIIEDETTKEEVIEDFEQYKARIYVLKDYVKSSDGMFTVIDPETNETYQADQKLYYLFNDVKYEYEAPNVDDKEEYITLEDTTYYIIGSGLDNNKSYYNVITEDKYLAYLYSIGD